MDGEFNAISNLAFPDGILKIENGEKPEETEHLKVVDIFELRKLG
jgi:hypothetical protein